MFAWNWQGPSPLIIPVCGFSTYRPGRTRVADVYRSHLHHPRVQIGHPTDSPNPVKYARAIGYVITFV